MLSCIVVLLTFEVDLTITVRVEDIDDALDEWILLELGQWHELIDAQGSRVVEVELLEAFP